MEGVMMRSPQALSAVVRRRNGTLVVRERQLLGLLTERDVVHWVALGRPLEGVFVTEAMTRQVVTLTMKQVQEGCDALEILCQHQSHHLPIVDSQNQLQGLVNFDRLYRVMQPQLKQQLHQEVSKALLAAIPDLIIRLSYNGTYLDCLPAEDFKLITPDLCRQGKNLFEVMPLVVCGVSADTMLDLGKGLKPLVKGYPDLRCLVLVCFAPSPEIEAESYTRGRCSRYLMRERHGSRSQNYAGC